MARYECTEGGHNKFWEFEQEADESRQWIVRISWGRIGWETSASSQVKIFATSQSADAFIIKKIREKQGKGYQLVRGAETNRYSPLPQSISEVWDGRFRTEIVKTPTKKTSKVKVKKETEGIDIIDFDLIAGK
jgi:predicted DNA-binding WGR domain protein